MSTEQNWVAFADGKEPKLSDVVWLAVPGTVNTDSRRWGELIEEFPKQCWTHWMIANVPPPPPKAKSQREKDEEVIEHIIEDLENTLPHGGGRGHVMLRSLGVAVFAHERDEIRALVEDAVGVEDNTGIKNCKVVYVRAEKWNALKERLGVEK